MAVALLLLAAGDLGSPESIRNVDSGVVADSAEAVDQVAAILEGKRPPVASVDRKVEAAQTDPRLAVDLERNGCPIVVTVVPAEVRLWDHYLSNFWELEGDLAVAPEILAAVKERLASPAEK